VRYGTGSAIRRGRERSRGVWREESGDLEERGVADERLIASRRWRREVAQVRVDRLSSTMAVREGGHHQVCAIHVVTAREDAGEVRLHRLWIHHEASPSVARHGLHGIAPLGGDVVSDGGHQQICRKVELPRRP
jgi:hypothetical protein